MDSPTQFPSTSTSTDDLELLALIANFESEADPQTTLVDEERYGGGIAVAFCVVA